jgi:cytoskeletal protein CcmA (bactofilin family)
MFSEKKEKSIVDPSASQNRINEGTNIVGDIQSKGFFRIDGIIEGNVSTPSKVVLGKTGLIKGNLTCEDADVEGKIIGRLNINNTLSLKATAFIEGDVVAGKLAVEPGATFNVSCIMKGTDKTNKEDSSMVRNKEIKKSQNHPFDRAQRIQKKEGQSS